MLLAIDEKDSRPIYLQIVNQIKEQVSRGTLQPQDELPSVRELADTLGINMHTVRSAYIRLRDQGIISMRLGRRARVAHVRSSPAGTSAVAGLTVRIKELITDASLMGLSPEDLRDLVNRELER